MPEFWFESGGARLFGRKQGQGPTVVMLHGALANHLAALPFVAPLSSDHQVVTPDLRGSGQSRFGEALSFDQLSLDLEVMLGELGVARAFIGGVSSGTGVALRLALRRPDLVFGLILVKPIYAGAERGHSREQQEILRGMDSIASRAIVEGVEVLKPMYENLPPTMREKALAMLEGFDAASVVATSRFVASGSQPFEAEAELRLLRVPTLLVRGNDALHPAQVSDLYAETIPDCVVEDAAADVAVAIRSFCVATQASDD